MNRNTTATILIILAVGIYFTVTEGMYDAVKEVRAVNDRYISALDSANELIKVRDKVLSDWRNISLDDQEKLAKMIPNTVDNIRLIIDLNSVAVRHGFSLKNIKAIVSTSDDKNQSGGNYAPVENSTFDNSYDYGSESSIIPTPVLDVVTVTFAVSAPYVQFQEFLQDLEANLRIMDLSHLAIVASDDGVYDFNVELKTYWLRQQ
jgi:hypothetical protein